MGLCLLIVNNTHQFGCGYRSCDFTCSKGPPSEVLLLEGQGDQTWKDHVRNCVPCHLPNVNGQIDPSLVIIPIGLWCMLCGQSTRVAIMLVCDQCSRGWHMAHLTLPLD